MSIGRNTNSNTSWATRVFENHLIANNLSRISIIDEEITIGKESGTVGISFMDAAKDILHGICKEINPSQLHVHFHEGRK